MKPRKDRIKKQRRERKNDIKDDLTILLTALNIIVIIYRYFRTLL